mmetsp:Transcript_3897/g.9832  ORF Transcript_3897/g.9832 Transcript_3897/m.9832 type:complete len:608 (-) Transcript_3897:151-1974(-)
MEPDLHYLLDTEPHDSDWQKVAESLATHPPPFSGNTKDYEIWYHGFKSTFSGLDGMKKYFHESLDDVLHHGLVVDDLGEWQKYNLEKEKWVLWRGLFEATKHQDCQATVVSAGKESDGYLSLLALRSRYEASIEQRRVEADASLNSWSYDERQGFPDNLGHLERLAETANQAHGHKKYDREDTAQRMLQDLKRHIDNPFCRELVRVFISGGKFNYARMKQSSSLVIAHLGDGTLTRQTDTSDLRNILSRSPSSVGSSTVHTLPVAGAAQEQRQQLYCQLCSQRPIRPLFNHTTEQCRVLARIARESARDKDGDVRMHETSPKMVTFSQAARGGKSKRRRRRGGKGKQVRTSQEDSEAIDEWSQSASEPPQAGGSTTDLSCLCEAGAAPAHKARVVHLDVLEEKWRGAECARTPRFIRAGHSDVVVDIRSSTTSDVVQEVEQCHTAIWKLNVAGAVLDSEAAMLDSGTTKHMFRVSDPFIRLNECTVSGRPGVLKLADGTLVPIKAEGVVQVTLCTASGSLKTIQLLHSLLVPQLTVNLLSIGQLTDSKCAVEFEEAGEVSCIKEKATGLLYPFLKYGAVYWIGLTHDRSMQLYSLFKNQFLVDACKD